VPKFQPVPVPPQQVVDKDKGTLCFPFKRWLETVQQALSNSGAPKSAKSAGIPVQVQGIETDGEFLYVCIGVNQWKRIALSEF